MLQDQVKAILLHVKSVIDRQVNPKDTFGFVDQLEALKEKHADDFLICKYFAKTALGYEPRS